MKKFLSFLVVCLSLSVTSNAMTRKLQESVEHSAADVCWPDDIIIKIICCMDYQEFIVFGMICTRSKVICQDVPQEYLKSIVVQAARHSNARLVCRGMGICPDNVVIKPCGENVFALWFNGQDRQQLASFLISDRLSSQECKDVLLLAVEYASLSLIEHLLCSEQFMSLVDQDCADAVVNKCIEVQRSDLLKILEDFSHVYGQMSLDVLFAFINSRNGVGETSEIEEFANSDDESDLSMDVEG